LGTLAPANAVAPAIDPSPGFLAVDMARHQYDVVAKIAAIPIFGIAVAISAWLAGTLSARLPSVRSLGDWCRRRSVMPDC
jgi:hypothetical protein